VGGGALLIGYILNKKSEPVASVHATHAHHASAQPVAQQSPAPRAPVTSVVPHPSGVKSTLSTQPTPTTHSTNVPDLFSIASILSIIGSLPKPKQTAWEQSGIVLKGKAGPGLKDALAEAEHLLGKDVANRIRATGANFFRVVPTVAHAPAHVLKKVIPVPQPVVPQPQPVATVSQSAVPQPTIFDMEKDSVESDTESEAEAGQDLENTPSFTQTVKEITEVAHLAKGAQGVFELAGLALTI
jgi:hypothetical protein